jgi:hypothetical protein
VPRGQLRLSTRELIARASRAAELRSAGLFYRQIGAEFQVSYTTAWRWVHWHADSIAAFGTVKVTRKQRLPLRQGRAWRDWGQAEFDRRVAERQRIANGGSPPGARPHQAGPGRPREGRA